MSGYPGYLFRAAFCGCIALALTATAVAQERIMDTRYGDDFRVEYRDPDAIVGEQARVTVDMRERPAQVFRDDLGEDFRDEFREEIQDEPLAFRDDQLAFRDDELAFRDDQRIIRERRLVTDEPLVSEYRIYGTDPAGRTLIYVDPPHVQHRYWDEARGVWVYHYDRDMPRIQARVYGEPGVVYQRVQPWTDHRDLASRMSGRAQRPGGPERFDSFGNPALRSGTDVRPLPREYAHRDIRRPIAYEQRMIDGRMMYLDEHGRWVEARRF